MQRQRNLIFEYDMHLHRIVTHTNYAIHVG